MEKARADELAFARKLEAFEPRPISEAYELMGRAPFGTRWIDCNKGDDAKPELRSRLVVQETRKTSTIAIDDIAAVTSATPPLEVVRLFLSLGMSMKSPTGEPLVWQFLDVSRAHPHVDVLRPNFYIRAPPEWGLDEDMCLLCRKCWYGMRDAGQAFEFAVRDHFASQGYEQGLFTPCVYKSSDPRRFAMYFIHGDDYVGLGTADALSSYLDALRQRFIIKVRAILGPEPGHDKEVRMLNRVITYRVGTHGKPDVVTYEADQRHADLLTKAYGLNASSKKKATPWSKPDFVSKHPLAGPLLGEERMASFRSSCMRALYLALDRPDIQFVCKEVSRAMSSPTINADETLKGLCRYLLGVPRVIWRFPRQGWPGKVTGLTDASWGGCPVTRKSTSATYLQLGSHPIYTGSTTQTVIALSSGESEFYGGVRCACRLLGLKALLVDCGLEVEAELGTDSAAGIGMASRRGAARIRHIHCPTLWLQQAISQKRLKIVKKLGTSLAPDVGTKAGVPAEKMWSLLQSFGIVRAEGRASAALQAAG